MKLIFTLILVAALGTSACNDILGDNDGNFTFNITDITFEEGMADTAEVLGLNRGLQVDGLIVLPHSCHTVTGNHAMDNGMTTLTVNAASFNPQCPGAQRAMIYRMQSFRLDRGIYRVRVFHQYPASQPVLILQEDVQVQ